MGLCRTKDSSTNLTTVAIISEICYEIFNIVYNFLPNISGL